jgi:hemerythrin-like domain-containing protein
MNQTIRIIRDEHRSIAAVLHGLQQLARDAQDARVRPGFDVFRAMIRYIDEFPEQLHHPKEDALLFARLALRAPQAKPMVEDLRAEHVEGARLVRELERALLFFEEGWPAGAADFLKTVNAYADFHWKHMKKEEEQLIPLCERSFTAEDWREMDAAFGANRDPIAGIREKDFETLFTRIVNLAPAPVGVGERWQKSS